MGASNLEEDKMEMIAIKCPACGATVDTDLEKSRKYTCQYCRKVFYLKLPNEHVVEEGNDDCIFADLRTTLANTGKTEPEIDSIIASMEKQKTSFLGCLGLFVCVAAIIAFIVWLIVPTIFQPTMNISIGESVEFRNVIFTPTNVYETTNMRVEIHFTIENNRNRDFRTYGGNWHTFVDGAEVGQERNIFGYTLGGATRRDYLRIGAAEGWEQIHIRYDAGNFRRFTVTIMSEDLAGNIVSDNHDRQIEEIFENVLGENADNEIVNEITDIELEIISRDNLNAELTTLFSGTFIVGQDIPPGRYKITGNGIGNVFVRRSDANILSMHGVNDILHPMDDGPSIFGVPSITTDLVYGDELEISGINEVLLTPVATELSTVLTAGNWIVGLDILAGTYYVKATNANEAGNFFVLTPGFSFDVNEILAGSERIAEDGNFGVEMVRVNLRDGQIVQISGLSSVTFEG